MIILSKFHSSNLISIANFVKVVCYYTPYCKLHFCFYIRLSEKKKIISKISVPKKFENLSIYLNNFVFLRSVKLINTLIGHSYAWYLTIERFFANESLTIETSYVSTRFSSSLITLSFFSSSRD